MSLSCDDISGTCSFSVRDVRPRQSCPSGQDCQPSPLTTSQPDSDQMTWMGTVNFTQGTFGRSADSPFAGLLTLSMVEDNPTLFMFTDRPYRRATWISIKSFASEFNTAFTDESGGKPNAYISLPQLERAGDNKGLYFFVIQNMEVENIVKDSNPTIVTGLNVKLTITESIPDGDRTPEYMFVSPVREIPPHNFSGGNLFIDGWFSDTLSNIATFTHSTLHAFANPRASAAALADLGLPPEEQPGSCFLSPEANPGEGTLSGNMANVQIGDTQGYFRRSIVNSGGGLRALYAAYGITRAIRKSVQLISHTAGSSTLNDKKQANICNPMISSVTNAGRKAFYQYGAGMYGISGGSWATASYCYSNLSDDGLFGQPWMRTSNPPNLTSLPVSSSYCEEGDWNHFNTGEPGDAVVDMITGDALVESWAQQIQEAIFDTAGVPAGVSFRPMGADLQEINRVARCRPHPNMGFIMIARSLQIKKNIPVFTCDGPLYGRTVGTFGSPWVNTPDDPNILDANKNLFCVNSENCDVNNRDNAFPIGGRMSNNIFNHRWYNNTMRTTAYEGGHLVLATPHPDHSAFEADSEHVWGGGQGFQAGASLLRAATYSSWAPGAVMARVGHYGSILTTSMDESFQSSYVSPDSLLLEAATDDGVRVGQTNSRNYYIDGGISCNLPTPAAIRNGCMDQTSKNWLMAGQEDDVQVLYIQAATSAVVDWSKADPLEQIADIRGLFKDVQSSSTAYDGWGKYAALGQYQEQQWVFETADYDDIQQMLLATYNTGFGMYAKKVCTVVAHPNLGFRTTGQRYVGQKVLVYLFVLSRMPAWEAAVGKANPDITAYLNEVNTKRASTSAGDIVVSGTPNSHDMFDSAAHHFPNFSTYSHLRWLPKVSELVMQQETFKFQFWMRRAKTALPFPGASLNFSPAAQTDDVPGIMTGGVLGKLPADGQELEIDADSGPPADFDTHLAWDALATDAGTDHFAQAPWNNPEVIWNYARRIGWVAGLATGATTNNFIDYLALIGAQTKMDQATLTLPTVDGSDRFTSIKKKVGNGLDGTGAIPTVTDGHYSGIVNGLGYDASHRYAFPRTSQSFETQRKLIYMLYQSADQSNSIQVGCTDNDGNYVSKLSWYLRQDEHRTMHATELTRSLEGFHEELLEGGHAHDYGNFGFASVPFVPLNNVPTNNPAHPTYMGSATASTPYPLNPSQHLTLLPYWANLCHTVRDDELDAWLGDFEVVSDPIMLTLTVPLTAPVATGAVFTQAGVGGTVVTGEVVSDSEIGDAEVIVQVNFGTAYPGAVTLDGQYLELASVEYQGIGPALKILRLDARLDVGVTLTKGWIVTGILDPNGVASEGTLFETVGPGQLYLKVLPSAGSGEFMSGAIDVLDGGVIQQTLTAQSISDGEVGSPFNETDVQPLQVTTPNVHSPWGSLVEVPDPLLMTGYVRHNRTLHLELDTPGVGWKPQCRTFAGAPVFTNNAHCPIPFKDLGIAMPWADLPAPP